LIHHRRVCQGAGIAETVQLVLGDLAQDAASYLAGAGLGQAGGPLDDIGPGDGTDFLHAQLYQLVSQRVGRFHTLHRRDVTVDALVA